MINYTEEQREAIDYFDTDLLISASSGSGKTQVLIEKIAQLISNGYKLEDFLVVTFTNLASNEMKNKLENILQDKFIETGDAKYFEALSKINTCDISTLHGFCQKIVKKYYYLLGIEPNFKILEDNQVLSLQNLAFDEMVKEYLENFDEEFKKISNLFVAKRDYRKFREEVLNFYEFLTSKINKFEFCKKMIHDSYNSNIEENEVLSKFRTYVNRNINYYIEKIKELKSEAMKIESEKLNSLCDDYLSVLYTFNTNSKMFLYFKNEFKFSQIRLKKNATIEEEELKEKFKVVSQKIKEFLNDLKTMFCYDSIQTLEEKFIDWSETITKFCEIVENFEKKYKNLKFSQNCLDFGDLEELTLKILENDEIKREISLKYKFIFVDEYQDTNLIQEKILQSISTFSKEIMVGDMKQSIYAFRECNPDIFNGKMKRFQESGSGKVIKLNKNFRSNKSILDFSNKIFSNLMRKENADYEYQTEGKFIFGNKDVKDEKPCICYINKSSENLEGGDFEEEENYLVLNTIYNLLQKTIIENKIERKMTYSDIAIISRKRNDKVKRLAQFLRENSLPVSNKYKEKIFDSYEVKLILSYLKILNDIDNDISLYSVLKNIYGFSTNELLLIKKEKLSQDLKKYNNNDEIKKKIDMFFKDYQQFSLFYEENNVLMLVKKIIEEKNLDIILSSKGKSSEKLNIFLSTISEDEYSISEFVNKCENLKDKKFEVKEVDAENSIIIDTFHSTKGLEYNAVIIYSCEDAMFSKNSSNLIYNAKFGIGIYDYDENEKQKNENLIFSIIKILNKQQEFNEEVRLFYVALTRAKVYLYVLGVTKEERLHQTNNIVEFLDFSNYLDLIFSTDITSFANIKKIEESEILENTKNDISEDEIESDNINYDIFNKYFNTEYKNEKSVHLQLKNSVTSLSSEDKEIYNISTFKLQELDKEDYIELGNSYHYALYNLPFYLDSEEEIRNSILNLISAKKLPENIYNYVDDKKLLKAIRAMRGLICDGDKIYKEKIFMLYVPYNEIIKSDIKDKILVQGIIDIFIEKENEIILVDYKTSRLQDINLIKKYDLQLKIYEKALREKFPNKTIKKYIYSIFLDKLINIV